MTVNEGLRMMAGFFTLLSLALGWYVSPYFFLFTAFVGLNQLQSAFSGWCPAMWMLKKAGFRQEVPVDGAAGSN
ncbi:MAG: YgaP family membrane protein [Pseudomonadota bacterium]